MNNYIPQDEKEKIYDFLMKEFEEYKEVYEKLAGGEDKDMEELDDL